MVTFRIDYTQALSPVQKADYGGQIVLTGMQVITSYPSVLHSRTLAVALICVGVLACGAARADIYAFVDENGTAHFSDVPQDRRFRLFLRDSTNTTTARAAARSGGDTLVRDKSFERLAAAHMAEIEHAANEHALDPKLLHAVIQTESGYNARAVSPRGAIGLMQLMPDTARRYGLADAFDPRGNVRAGARYLRDLLELFAQNLPLALAAYNAGEGAVARYGNRIPPFPETLAYVPRVIERYEALRGGGNSARKEAPTAALKPLRPGLTRSELQRLVRARLGRQPAV